MSSSLLSTTLALPILPIRLITSPTSSRGSCFCRFANLATRACIIKAESSSRSSLLYLLVRFRVSSSRCYGASRSDAYFIGFYFILFWFLRDASMRWLLEPLARRAGITRKRSIVRFAEQGWAFLYYSVFSTLGLVSFSPLLLKCALFYRAACDLCLPPHAQHPPPPYLIRLYIVHYANFSL